MTASFFKLEGMSESFPYPLSEEASSVKVRNPRKYKLNLLSLILARCKH